MAIASQLSLCAEQTRLDTLVDDVLIYILSLLPVWDVLHLRQTSKRMEALSHVCAVWRALFARDVVTCGRPIPGFSFAPTPRLLQLCALDPSDDLCHAEFQNIENFVTARALIEASDLEARTLHALRLDKTWNAPVAPSKPGATSVPNPNISSTTNANETRLRTFQTPAAVRDIFLLPGGRFVVSLHADRLRCWDLGVPHALSTAKSHTPAAGVRCVGEVVLSRHLAEAAMCMDARPSSPSISVYGRHSESSIFFALSPDAVHADLFTSSEMTHATRRRTCEVLSVRLDPLRSGPALDLHDTASVAGSVSVTGSPFASPVPFFRHEATVKLPEVLIAPSYPEGSVSAQTMVGPQWGPERFARGKLGRLLLVYGSVMFFESFIPPPPVDGEGEDGPKYVGIEVLDWNEPTSSVLFEYPDPQVGQYIGVHVYFGTQVLVVWQNCAGLYPLPFRQSALSSSSSSLSLSGSATGLASARSSRPSTPSRASDASKFSSSPETSSTSLYPSPSPTPLCSSPGSSRSCLGLDGADVYASPSGTLVDEDVKINSAPEANYQPEPKRTVMMPIIVFALSEPIEAPIAFSVCSGSERNENSENKGVPHPLTIVARSRTHPTRNVQSVLTASLNPYPEDDEDKFRFRLSRIPASTPDSAPSSEASESIAALAFGPSGRGVRANSDGTLYRCTRAEVVLPRFGYGLGYGTGYDAPASGVPTVDFWPWRVAAVLSLRPSLSSSSSPSQNEMKEENLVLRFDDGMGRVVAARVPQAQNGLSQGTSEVSVLDFA